MTSIYLYADETNPKAVQAKKELSARYPDLIAPLEKSDVIVSLGGDGTTLLALQLALKHNKKVYGMNLGHLGAYQNTYKLEDLPKRLKDAYEVPLHPLRVRAQDVNGNIIEQAAFNDIYVRSGDNPQQARLAGTAGKYHFTSIGDGHLIASPMGSRAYNLSAGGHKLHFKEHLLASTSIAACKGVQDILPAHTPIHLEAMQTPKRSVGLFADSLRLGTVFQCDISQDFSKTVTLLWDKEKISAATRQGDETVNGRSKIMRRSLEKRHCWHSAYTRT